MLSLVGVVEVGRLFNLLVWDKERDPLMWSRPNLLCWILKAMVRDIGEWGEIEI